MLRVDVAFPFVLGREGGGAAVVEEDATVWTGMGEEVLLVGRGGRGKMRAVRTAVRWAA